MRLHSRVILPVLMSGIMVLVVTLVVTLQTHGLQAGFLGHWLRAYLVAWPVAAVTAYCFLPSVQRLTERIVSRWGGG